MTIKSLGADRIDWTYEFSRDGKNWSLGDNQTFFRAGTAPTFHAPLAPTARP